MAAPNLPKGFGYVRVSTARQADDGLSLDVQEAKVREALERENCEVREIYVERGVSGRKGSRPELDRLLSRLDEVDVLVIPKLDRLGRSAKHLHDAFEVLENANVSLVCLSPPIDTSTSSGKLMRNILATLAEFESDLIKERVESVVTAAAEKGSKHAAWPFGYSKNGVPVEPAASIVRRIFQETADGRTQREIARRINAEGVLTPKGNQWGQTQIKATLEIVTYTGRIETNGNIYPATHDAIVSLELWEEVKRVRAANRRGRNGSAAGAKLKSPHLFTRGLLRCALCGEAMVPNTQKRYEAYICASRMHRGVDACTTPNVSRKLLDAAVFSYFERVAVDLDATRAELEEHVAAADTARKATLRVAKAKLAFATASSDGLERDYLRGDIDGKGYTRIKAMREREIAEAEQVLASPAPTPEPQAVRNAASMIEAMREEIASGVTTANGLDGIRARLGVLFERFEVAAVEPERPLSAAERIVMREQGQEYDDDLIEAGGWTICPVPREDWVGALDGYWQSILRPMPLPGMSTGALLSTSRRHSQCRAPVR